MVNFASRPSKERSRQFNPIKGWECGPNSVSRSRVLLRTSVNVSESMSWRTTLSSVGGEVLVRGLFVGDTDGPSGVAAVTESGPDRAPSPCYLWGGSKEVEYV